MLFSCSSNVLDNMILPKCNKGGGWNLINQILGSNGKDYGKELVHLSNNVKLKAAVLKLCASQLFLL